MQSLNFKKKHIIEGFEQMSNVPTENLVAWMETTQYNDKNYNAIDKWTPVSSAPNGNFFENTSNDKNRLPFVKSNVLNGHAVLNFNPNKHLRLNNLGGTSADYTIIMVCRQIGGTNQRLLQGIDNNALFGYWGGSKEVFYVNGESKGATQKSDSNWDVYVFRRSNDNKGFVSMRNLGTILHCHTPSGGLNGLGINVGQNPGETSDGQFAEFMLYNKYLSDEDVIKIEAYLGKKWGLLDKMDPNVPGSTNTKGANVGEVNANAPSSASDFPVTNVKFWVDAAAIPIPKDGATLDSWNSSTKDNKYFLQKKGGNPIIKTNVLNKLPVVQFNTSSFMGLNNIPLIPSQMQFTLAFVTRQTGGANSRLIGASDSADSCGGFMGYWNGLKNVSYVNGKWISGPGSPGVVSSNTDWDLYIVTQNYRGNHAMIRNNQVIYNGHYIGLGTLNGIGINMCGERSDGQVAEIIMWDRCLLNKEINIVSTYLIKKWNLQLFLDKNDPLYNEGVQIKQQRDQEAAAAAAEAARLKAEKDAAQAAELAKKIKADADARAAADAAIFKKQQDAIAAAEKQIADAKKALADAQMKEKRAAEEQAIVAAAIEAKQKAAIEAAKKQDEELRKQLANEQASASQILAAAKTYAEQQKKIQEENISLFNSKLASAEETLINKTNLFNSRLASTISENDTKLKSVLTLAETNLQKALIEAERRETNRLKQVKEEETKYFTIKLDKQEDKYEDIIDDLLKNKKIMQENNSKLLQSTLLTAQEKLNLTIAQTIEAGNNKYNTLQELATKKEKTLAEQLINLQNKYNADIYAIAQEANNKYNALKESDIIKITNLQNQLSTASTALINSFNKYKKLEEETLISSEAARISDREKYIALEEAYNANIVKAISEYNALIALDEAKYSGLQEASKMILDKTLSKYKKIKSTQPKQVLASSKKAASKIAKSKSADKSSSKSASKSSSKSASKSSSKKSTKSKSKK